MTYLPKTMTILSERTYRLWVDEEDWLEVEDNLVDSGFEARVVMCLIDALPSEVHLCQVLP